MVTGKGVLAMVLGGVLLLSVTGETPANTVVNGDFETGDLAGWTTFETEFGTVGAAGSGYPDVQPFDTNNDSAATPSARFQVGRSFASEFGQTGGGGIFQELNLLTGELILEADIASHSTSNSNNGSGGLFELLLDNVVVDTHDFGEIAAGVNEFDTLFVNTPVDAGPHEIRIQMTRPAFAGGGTPEQYIDNVMASGSATVPLPAASWVGLATLGALVIAPKLRRHGQSPRS